MQEHVAPSVTSLAAPAFNFFVLVGALAYYLKQPLKSFVHQRHLTVGEDLRKVRQLLRESQERYDEFSAKLKAIDVELTSLREQARQDAQTTKLRILSEAQRTSGHIVADARTAAEGLYSELKSKLYGDFAGRILERAESIMRERLTGDDRARIQKEFSTQVENAR